MEERLWQFVDAAGDWVSRSYGMPRMIGRVFAWLLVCDPPEQTAAQLADALQASQGSISGATAMLVRLGLVDRLRVPGERAGRFRVREGVWDSQIQDPGADQARALVAQGLEALAGEPAPRRARLEEMDALYAWYQARMPSLLDEWREYKRKRLGVNRDD
jgi:DNA-binding transcriptional regulator GbsR (MarR family)